MDIRCIYCNWLMKEVQENFVCSNCGKENTIKEAKKVKKEAKKQEDEE